VDPAGNKFSASAVHSGSTGEYGFDVGPVSIAGRWHYRFEASGALVAAEESSFYVRASRVL
jgi:hypothetical protein